MLTKLERDAGTPLPPDLDEWITTLKDILGVAPKQATRDKRAGFDALGIFEDDGTWLEAAGGRLRTGPAVVTGVRGVGRGSGTAGATPRQVPRASSEAGPGGGDDRRIATLPSTKHTLDA
jgi:hypothetical protein